MLHACHFVAWLYGGLGTLLGAGATITAIIRIVAVMVMCTIMTYIIWT